MAVWALLRWSTNDGRRAYFFGQLGQQNQSTVPNDDDDESRSTEFSDLDESKSWSIVSSSSLRADNFGELDLSERNKATFSRGAGWKDFRAVLEFD